MLMAKTQNTTGRIKARTARDCATKARTFKKSLYGKEANVKTSYVLTHKNSKKRKPEGESIKDCLLDSVAVICQGTTESFKNLSLLRRTVTRQIEDITGNLLQLYLYLYVCVRTNQKHNQGADFHAVKEQDK